MHVKTYGLKPPIFSDMDNITQPRRRYSRANIICF